MLTLAPFSVRWDAKSPHEFIDNYKIIQQVLDKKGIDKHIEVEKLMRAKYQDNLENMQVRNIYHAPLGHFLLCILFTHSCVTLTSCHITGMFPSLI